MRKYALVSTQGTACYETVLYEDEYTPEMREKIEKQYCTAHWDAPLAGSWRDVSDNDAV